MNYHNYPSSRRHCLAGDKDFSKPIHTTPPLQTPTMPSCEATNCHAISKAFGTTLEMVSCNQRNKAKGRTIPGAFQGSKQAKRCRGSGSSSPPSLEERNHWAGEASLTSPACLLLSSSCVAGSWPLKILTVVMLACLLGPGNSSEQLSVHFFISACLTRAQPSPLSVPGRGQSLASHGHKGARWKYTALGYFCSK